jgi:hypothetical protein
VSPEQVPSGYSRAGQMSGAGPGQSWLLRCHRCATVVNFAADSVHTHNEFHAYIDRTLSKLSTATDPRNFSQGWH